MSSVGVPLSPHESPWQSCRTEPLTWRVRCSPQQWSGGSVSVEGHSDVSKNWWPGGKRTSELGAEPFRHICHPEALRTRPSGFLWRHFWSRLHYAGIYGVFGPCLHYTTNFPGSAACKPQVITYLNLPNCMSQFP